MSAKLPPRPGSGSFRPVNPNAEGDESGAGGGSQNGGPRSAPPSGTPTAAGQRTLQALPPHPLLASRAGSANPSGGNTPTAQNGMSPLDAAKQPTTRDRVERDELLQRLRQQEREQEEQQRRHRQELERQRQIEAEQRVHFEQLQRQREQEEADFFNQISVPHEPDPAEDAAAASAAEEQRRLDEWQQQQAAAAQQQQAVPLEWQQQQAVAAQQQQAVPPAEWQQQQAVPLEWQQQQQAVAAQPLPAQPPPQPPQPASAGGATNGRPPSGLPPKQHKSPADSPSSGGGLSPVTRTATKGSKRQLGLLSDTPIQTASHQLPAGKDRAASTPASPHTVRTPAPPPHPPPPNAQVTCRASWGLSFPRAFTLTYALPRVRACMSARAHTHTYTHAGILACEFTDEQPAPVTGGWAPPHTSLRCHQPPTHAKWGRRHVDGRAAG